jgi:hypothetical protein
MMCRNSYMINLRLMHTPFGKSLEKNMKIPNGLIKSKPWRRHLRIALCLHSTSFSLKCHLSSKEEAKEVKTLSLCKDRSDRCRQRHNYFLDGQEGKEEKDQGRID